LDGSSDEEAEAKLQNNDKPDFGDTFDFKKARIRI
jgi:hypothetical protein